MWLYEPLAVSDFLPVSLARGPESGRPDHSYNRAFRAPGVLSLIVEALFVGVLLTILVRPAKRTTPVETGSSGSVVLISFEAEPEEVEGAVGAAFADGVSGAGPGGEV